MVHLVPAAFFAARLTNVCADLTELLGELAAARHVAGSQAAYRRAVNVKGDTPCHHLHVLLLKSGCRTVVASVRAGVAHIDASWGNFVSHENLLLLRNLIRVAGTRVASAA
jgi:hypothetical protein